MAQASIGQVENLQEFIRGLESVREALESACQEQIAAAEGKSAEAREEAHNSKNLLDRASQAEQEAQRAVAAAEFNLESAESALSAAESALSACEAQPPDEHGAAPVCAGEQADVASAQSAVQGARDALQAAREELQKALENRQWMEQRVEYSAHASAMAAQILEQAQHECASRMQRVVGSIDTGKARLAAAHRALEAYLATTAPAARFNEWLHWYPERGKPVAADVIRDRLNLTKAEQGLLHAYLYDRDSAYRNMVDRYRNEWAAAKGDVERNIVNRIARIHLSSKFSEQMARHALAPLGGKIETQGRTYVGDGGKYTKTDLIVTDLRVPVVLGRGEGMGAPVGGSMAFEVKCGKADYLYSEKNHMIFQAEGHRKADARCTLCSRDVHELPPGKEKELRDALRAAGSPIVGILPTKNDIDQSCLAFIHPERDGLQR